MRPEKNNLLNLNMVSYLQLKFRTLAWFTVSLPLGSFVFCVIWSILHNFERATFTHCQVVNYLPSISAAIGSFRPQIYVWQLGIAVHALPRFLVTGMYYSHLCEILPTDAMWQWLASVIFLLQFTEICSLLGLTFVSSSENFHVHEMCFVTFMVTSLSNMLLLYVSMKYGTKHKLTIHETWSLKYKSTFGLINISSFFLAVYFYFRHNWYCEPFVYTFFALFEYIVVVSNMGYHLSAYWDFFDHIISVSSCCSLSITQKERKFIMNDLVIKIA